jgi:hypothetical protein
MSNECCVLPLIHIHQKEKIAAKGGLSERLAVVLLHSLPNEGIWTATRLDCLIFLHLERKI